MTDDQDMQGWYQHELDAEQFREYVMREASFNDAVSNVSEYLEKVRGIPKERTQDILYTLAGWTTPEEAGQHPLPEPF